MYVQDALDPERFKEQYKFIIKNAIVIPIAFFIFRAFFAFKAYELDI